MRVFLLAAILSSWCVANEPSVVVLREAEQLMPSQGRHMEFRFAPLPSSTKSKKLVFFYSLLMPGMGDLYLKDWNVREWGSGKYFFATEVLLWASHFYSNSRSQWLAGDYKALAARHAGVVWGVPKPDKYETNIGKFSDIYYFNDVYRRASGTTQLYEENDANYWRWDSESHRKLYDRTRIQSQKFDRISQYLIFGIVVNHFMAGMNSIREYRRLQRALGVQMDFRVYPSRAGAKYGYVWEAALSKHL